MILQIQVKPNARTSSLQQDETGVWRAQLKSPPVDGKANTELIGLLARHFSCPKAAVRIKAGGSGRTKLVELKLPG